MTHSLRSASLSSYTLEIVVPNQAIDERQTSHDNSLPGFWISLTLVIQDQVMNLSFAEKHLVGLIPSGWCNVGIFWPAGTELSMCLIYRLGADL